MDQRTGFGALMSRVVGNEKLTRKKMGGLLGRDQRPAVAESQLCIMKHPACISVFSLFLVGCASNRRAQSDLYFLPCAAKASASFEGETQAGRDVHRLEVRRLAYVSTTTKKWQPTMGSCVIYYAGDEYGPSILRMLDDCITPLVQKVSNDVVEIYFGADAHTHIRQRWRLLGYTAKLENEEAIEWNDDPRMKEDAEPHVPANRSQPIRSETNRTSAAAGSVR